MTPSMNTDSVGDLANAKGSNERDQAVPRASVSDVSTTEEVGPRKRTEALKSWQGAIALTSKDRMLQ